MWRYAHVRYLTVVFTYLGHQYIGCKVVQHLAEPLQNRYHSGIAIAMAYAVKRPKRRSSILLIRDGSSRSNHPSLQHASVPLKISRYGGRRAGCSRLLYSNIAQKCARTSQKSATIYDNPCLFCLRRARVSAETLHYALFGQSHAHSSQVINSSGHSDLSSPINSEM